MASTYALPIDNASPARGHGHSRSHFAADHAAPWPAQMNGASPPRAPSQAGGAHRPARSEMNGQLYTQGLSPYGHQHNQSRDHGHSHSRSTESTYTLKPFMNVRPQMRPRGESDLGRPAGSKGGAMKQAFSPIHEHPNPLPLHSPSWYVYATRRKRERADWQPGRGLNSPKRSQLSSYLCPTSSRRSRTSTLCRRAANRLQVWRTR
jgi:zinc transporter 5/7